MFDTPYKIAMTGISLTLTGLLGPFAYENSKPYMAAAGTAVSTSVSSAVGAVFPVLQTGLVLIGAAGAVGASYFLGRAIKYADTSKLEDYLAFDRGMDLETVMNTTDLAKNVLSHGVFFGTTAAMAYVTYSRIM